MLTKSYELDGMGRWKRRIADFAEDIVVACAGCGVERDGSVEVEGDEFVFVAAGVMDRISEAIQAKEE